MSAFIVDKVHIDALVTAGLILPRPYGPMHWIWPELTEEDQRDAYQRGEPWGPRAIQLIKERTHELTHETTGRVGAMLLAENASSTNHRYDEEKWEQPYTFTELRGHPDPVIVLSALRCYEYQSCEHPGWPKSEAYAFCRNLQAVAIRNLPGMDSAPWEITDPNVFLTAQLRK